MARRSSLATAEKVTRLRAIWRECQQTATSLRDGLDKFSKLSDNASGVITLSVSSAGHSASVDPSRAKEYPILAEEFFDTYDAASTYLGAGATDQSIFDEMRNILFCASDVRQDWTALPR